MSGRRSSASGPSPTIVGLLAFVTLGGIGASRRWRSQRSRYEDRCRDRLHHRVLPNLHAAERALAQADLDTALLQIRSATRGARSLLQPRPDHDPVGSAVDAALEVWAPSLRIDVPTCEALPAAAGPDLREAVHLITFEALNNAARHQHPAEARVALRCDPTQVTVSVASTGPRSTGSSTPAGGHGLAAMDQAARAVGGRVSVDVDGSGAVVVGTFPLRRPQWTGVLPLAPALSAARTARRR